MDIGAGSGVMPGSENPRIHGIAAVLKVEDDGDRCQRQGGDKRGAQSQNNHCSSLLRHPHDAASNWPPTLAHGLCQPE